MNNPILITCPNIRGHHKALYKPERMEHLNDNDLITKYLPIWKSMLMEQNKLSEEFFMRHIKIFHVDTSSYANNTYLNVGFEYKSEWASTDVYNEIIIKINDTKSPFYNTSIPINEYLTKVQISGLSNTLFYSPNRISKISSDVNLKYSFESAKQYLKNKIKITRLCNSTCSINDDGHLTLRYSDYYFDERQFCTNAELDLVTGHLDITVSECIVCF